MTVRHFVVATAGHVDHGKSALVKSLTGVDPDRLPEEKARGITIDLGFAELNLQDAAGRQFHVGIIDVPGHENFIRNMIAGVGSIDLALLVVAADDGWMPQTEEHFQILHYLGVERMVVAITKADIGDPLTVQAQIREQLAGTRFASATLVATSSRTGAGLEKLQQAIASELAALPPVRDPGKPRLHVDRAFILQGIGTIVTGTLTGGHLRRGQAVSVQPGNRVSRLRSVQNHGRDSEMAAPAMRTAVNITDLGVGLSRASIKRGDVVTLDGFATTTQIDVLLEKSDRLTRDDPAARPLKNGTSLFLHYGTARLAAKAILLQSETLEVGRSEIAQLRLESPILAFHGDRFVLRDQSSRQTIAGGIVLDPAGDRKSFRSDAQRVLLKARAAAPLDLSIALATEIDRHGPLKISHLLLQSHFSREEIELALAALQNKGFVVIRELITASREVWDEQLQAMAALIDRAHLDNSAQPGLDLNELRSTLPDPFLETFETLVSDLCANGFVRKGSALARASHSATLPAPFQAAAEQILRILREKPSDPPGRRELLAIPGGREAIRFLLGQGNLIEISPELILPPENLNRMQSVIVENISKNGPATVSILRKELETSRRIIVPLLEYLDRHGVTRRVGDQRTLANESRIARLGDASTARSD